VSGGSLRAKHYAEKVHTDDALKISQVVIQEALVHGAPDAGIVEHDVEAAELRHGKVDQGLDFVRAGDISLLETTNRAHCCRQFLAARGIDIGDHDPGPFMQEKLNGCAA